MGHNTKTSPQTLRRVGRWPALQRLGEAIERNTGANCYADKIRLLLEAYFADVDEFEKTNPVVLPP
jgi:hypothetical protein